MERDMGLRRHKSYAKYVVKHKWFVMFASLVLIVEADAPWGLMKRALIHDKSKFLPSEWMPYAECFYSDDGSKRCLETPEFIRAWNSHQKANKHHWQYWLIMMDSGVWEALEMPEIYVYEMVADWMGAGRTITGRWEVQPWYEANRGKMVLHQKTRRLVESILEQV
jgi:hypothetical protein